MGYYFKAKLNYPRMPGERVIAWHQKLGVALLVTIGLATFVLGIVRIKTAVATPGARRTDITFKSDEQLEIERTEKLKNTDTDGDELMDYDELYVFRTSPFLEDSDSDGFSDGQEVALNNDPNCPRGRTCRQAASGGSAAQPTASSGITAEPGTATPASPAPEEEIYQLIIDTFGDPTKLTAATITTKLDAMSSAELRTFLTAMGVPESALAKADDATLKKLLGETLIEIAAGGAAAQ